MENKQNVSNKNLNTQANMTKPVEPEKKSFNEQEFIQNLELFYFGETVRILENAKKLTGDKGKVSYKIAQPEDFKGTDYVSVSFLLTKPERKPFAQMKFSLLVNTTTGVVVDTANAFADQKPLTEKELTFTLGGFGPESIVEKKEKAQATFLKFMDAN